MSEKVGADERARMDELAHGVRHELAAAGLPILAPLLDPALAGGADVEVDYGADAGGGVYVAWWESPHLQACGSRVLRLRLQDDSVLRHCFEIGAAMMQAMATILTSAGFTVEDANDEYRPHQLRVTDGPAPGVAPMWELRDDELAMEDRQCRRERHTS